MVGLACLAVGSRPAAASAPATEAPTAPAQAAALRAERVLGRYPLIDGHNDWAWELHERFDGEVERLDLATLASPPGHAVPLGSETPPLMTDLSRLRQGHVGGQFWSAWVPPETGGIQAAIDALRQVDIIRRLVASSGGILAMSGSTVEIEAARRQGRIASMVGLEGGHQIAGSLDLLRDFYALGVRYMTLTHTLTTDWADSATDAPRHHGLAPFGVAVVREMNRIGMMVDLSHTSPDTMRCALRESVAPVIFSHSGARAVADHPRNVPDDVLRSLGRNGGVVMVGFMPEYATSARIAWEADRAAERARLGDADAGMLVGRPDRQATALAAWIQAHPAPAVAVSDVADHVDHVARIAGIGHVGIGSDFDGTETVPVGLEGVDRFPALFVELARRGWGDAALAGLARGNVLRVMRAVEAVSGRMRAGSADRSSG